MGQKSARKQRMTYPKTGAAELDPLEVRLSMKWNWRLHNLSFLCIPKFAKRTKKSAPQRVLHFNKKISVKNDEWYSVTPQFEIIASDSDD